MKVKTFRQYTGIIISAALIFQGLLPCAPANGYEATGDGSTTVMAVSENWPGASEELYEEAGADPCVMVQEDDPEYLEIAPPSEGIVDGAGSSGLKELIPGTDYDDDSIVAEADSRGEALKVAEIYGGSLESFEYGIATISISENSACDVLDRYTESCGELPAIYPNIYSTLCVHDDPYLSDGSDCYQWQHGPGFLNTEKAWESTKGEGITVAVIDTGVTNMDEFGDRLLAGVNVSGSGFTGDYSDCYGHGTHVAGIIAAGLDDGMGGAGVAPEVKIFPIRAFYYNAKTKNYESDSATLTRAVYAAISKGVDIINFSAGTPVSSGIEKKAWQEALDAGIVVVAAAGNTHTDRLEYPAAMKDVISVAALTKEGTLADFSNYGNTVNLAAPGEGIWSAITEDMPMYYSGLAKGRAKGQYVCADGTSMAAPAVTGVAALILSVNPSIKGNGKNTSKAVKDILEGTVHNESYYREFSDTGEYVPAFGAGIYGGVNAYLAVEAAKEGTKPQAPLIDIRLEDGVYLIDLKCNIPGSDIYYTLDGSKPSEVTGERFTGEFAPGISGPCTVRAIALVGKNRSRIATLKYDFDIRPESVSLNGGRDIYLVPGGHAQAEPEFTPACITQASVSYRIEGSGFTVDDKGVITCEESAPEGATAMLIGTVGDVSGSVRLIASRDIIGIIAVPETIKLTALDTPGTISANLSVSVDMLENIRVNSRKDRASFIIKSSKPSVVRVVNNRYLYAVSKGKANVTVYANDGSGKKAKCKVSVIMPVVNISAVKTSTGFLEFERKKGSRESKLADLYYDNDSLTDETVDHVPIARGGKLKLTGYLNEDYRWKRKASPSRRTIPSNRKMDYYVSGNGASYIGVRNGIVTCRNSAPAGKTFTVTLKAADGFGAERSINFRVYEDPGEIGFKDPGYRVKNELSVYETSFRRNGRQVDGILGSILKRGSGSCETYTVKLDRNKISRSFHELIDENTGGTVRAYSWLFISKGTTGVTFRTRDGSNRSFSLKLLIE